MKSILPTILIINIGILCGCSSTPSAVVTATSKKAWLLPVDSKIHVVAQSAPAHATSPEFHPSTPAVGAEGRDIETVKSPPTLSNLVATQLAEKGYTLVPSLEADYVVSAHIFPMQGNTQATPIIPLENHAKDLRTPVVHPSTVLHQYFPLESGPSHQIKSSHPSPASEQGSSDYLDRPDMGVEPDQKLTLYIQIIKVSGSLSKRPEIVWTGKLVTQYEVDPQRCVRTLLNYLDQDFHNKTLLALK